LSVTPLAPGPLVAGTGITTEGTVLAAGDTVAVLVGVVAACDCEPTPGKDRSANTAATARTRTITRRERCI
jgi:hypothetical protein